MQNVSASCDRQIDALKAIANLDLDFDQGTGVLRRPASVLAVAAARRRRPTYVVQGGFVQTVH